MHEVGTTNSKTREAAAFELMAPFRRRVDGWQEKAARIRFELQRLDPMSRKSRDFTSAAGTLLLDIRRAETVFDDTLADYMDISAVALLRRSLAQLHSSLASAMEKRGPQSSAPI